VLEDSDDKEAEERRRGVTHEGNALAEFVDGSLDELRVGVVVSLLEEHGPQFHDLVFFSF
jgi:hypothetical protein